MFKYSKNRKFIVNLIFTIFCLVGIIIIPSLLDYLFSKIIHNDSICLLLSDFIFIVIVYLLYFKDLNSEFKHYFKNFKKFFKYSFKIYIIGYMAMIFFSLFAYMFVKDISFNEEQVREMLYNNTVITMITISIIAPLSEEIVFRKSLQPLIKNKWIYILVCGLLFGTAHIMTDILNNQFALTDLLFILPYGSLGASLALMDYDTKTTYSSIVIHALHNTLTGLLLLLTHIGGM